MRMFTQRKLLSVMLAIGLNCCFATVSTAARAMEDRAGRVEWTTVDVSGAKVTVPAPDALVVVAFIRADQPQSQEALDQVAAAAKDRSDVRVVVVFDGERAVVDARAFVVAKRYPGTWPVVADPDFAASGRLGVHVWPTVVMVGSDGSQVAHLAGVAKSFTTELRAYLDFGTRKIDQVGLKQRLTTRDVIADSSEQMAARHLQVARRFLDAGQLDSARKQIEAGLALSPDDGGLKAAMAQLHIQEGKPQEALTTLDALAPGAAPAWQIALLRTRACVALEKWEEAARALPEAMQLNPDPAEAHYLAGLLAAHASDWKRAAEAFRAAYESRATAGTKSGQGRDK